MRVSVVVPVYNVEKYLRQCLDSVLAQTFDDIEVVVVDDGSTDSSPGICDEYSAVDERVKVVHTPNCGLGAARNTGTRLAKGDYIMYVDSDDVVDHRIVATLIGLIDRHKASAAFCSFTSQGVEALSPCGEVKILSSEKAVELSLYQTAVNSSMWAKLFPADILKTVAEPEGKLYEDLATFYRVCGRLSGDLVCTSAPMYFYRPNGGSILHTFSERRLDVLDITDEIVLHFCGKPALAAAARDRRFSAHFNIMLLALLAGMSDAADRCWSVVKSGRKEAILNPKVRLKNKIGALLSYFGKRAVVAAGKIIY